jgi:hypothetical protein
MSHSPEMLEEKAARAEARVHAAMRRADFARGRVQLAVTLPARDTWASERERNTEAAELAAQQAAEYRRRAADLRR